MRQPLGVGHGGGHHQQRTALSQLAQPCHREGHGGLGDCHDGRAHRQHVHHGRLGAKKRRQGAEAHLLRVSTAPLSLAWCARVGTGEVC